MLVLSRKPEQSIIVDGQCRITVLNSACRLGIEGNARVFREELLALQTAPVASRPTIYLVDDDAHLLQAYERFLNHFDFEVKSFRRGGDFLQHAEGKVDASAVVLDLRLTEEDIDGLQILQQLRAWDHDYPVILLTGYGDVATCRRAFQNGCYTFLQKPLKPEDMVATVKEAVARYERGEFGKRHQLRSLVG